MYFLFVLLSTCWQICLGSQSLTHGFYYTQEAKAHSCQAESLLGCRLIISLKVKCSPLKCLPPYWGLAPLQLN